MIDTTGRLAEVCDDRPLPVTATRTYIDDGVELVHVVLQFARERSASNTPRAHARLRWRPGGGMTWFLDKEFTLTHGGRDARRHGS